MKIIFISNGYIELLKGNIACLDMFWPDQEMTIIGFDKPEFDLPDRFNFISAGKQEDFGGDFCKPIRPVLESLDTETITIFLDDTYLVGEVDQELYDKAHAKVESGEVQKVDLCYGSDSMTEQSTVYDDTFNVYNQDMNFRHAMTCCIVNKKHFLSFFRDGLSIWKFERNNIKKAKNDGAKLLWSKSKPIAPWVGIARKACFDRKILPLDNIYWSKYKTDIAPGAKEVILKYSNWCSGSSVDL